MPHKRAKRSVRESEKEKKGHNLPPRTHTGSSGYTDADTPKGATRIINALATQTAYHDKKRAHAEDGNRQAKGKGKASNQSANGGKDTLKIMPGETLGQFNRRLEDHMRPMVSQAMKDAASKQAQQEREVWQEKKKRREEAKEAKKVKEAKEQEDEGVGRRRKRTGDVGSEEEDEDEEPVQDTKRRRKEPVKVVDAPSSMKPIKAKSKMDMSTGFAPIPKPPPLHDIALAPPILPGLRKSSTPATTSHFAVTGRTPLSAGQKRLMEEERERVVARYREMKEAKRVEQQSERVKADKGKVGKRKRPTQDV